MDISLVQILVVVVITNVRFIWTDVENGFRLSALLSELADPKTFVKHDKKWEEFYKFFIESKGKQVKIPVQGKRGGATRSLLGYFYRRRK